MHSGSSGARLAGNRNRVLAGTIDVLLNTGDISRLRAFRLNWLVLLEYLSSSQGINDAHHSIAVSAPITDYNVSSSSSTGSNSNISSNLPLPLHSSMTKQHVVKAENSQGVKSNFSILTQLKAAMNLACRRAQYVCDLPDLFEQYCEPADVWW
tara:strand:- start:216 stop:674 length:459 start_codon:yes stop_codon:yes gene_type:complete